MTTIENITSVRNLNNHGTSLMATGEYRMAAIQFSRALQIMKQCLATISSSHGTTASESNLTCTLSVDECMIQSCAACMGATEAESSDSQTMVPVPYIHRQAIFIPDDVVVAAAMEATSTMGIAAIVIFNSALSYQLQSTSENDTTIAVRQSRQLLTKASKLYELAFSLYKNQARTGGQFFFMTLINNLALVKYDLGDTVGSEQCFEYLLSIFMCVIDTGNRVPQSRLCDGFLRNIFHLVSPHITSPAA